eukprot:136616_1
MTALTTRNGIIRDLSLGAFFVFTLMFLYIYEAYILLISSQPKNMPYPAYIYWTISAFFLFPAVAFRATKFPESFFVKREFKKLMKKAYQERFAIQSGGNDYEYKIKTDKNKKQKLKQDDNDTDEDSNDNDEHKRATATKQHSFEKMLADMQSYSYQTQNALANIENLDSHLYDDVDNDVSEGK